MSVEKILVITTKVRSDWFKSFLEKLKKPCYLYLVLWGEDKTTITANTSLILKREIVFSNNIASSFFNFCRLFTYVFPLRFANVYILCDEKDLPLRLPRLIASMLRADRREIYLQGDKRIFQGPFYLFLINFFFSRVGIYFIALSLWLWYLCRKIIRK
jgi:hypothetical protein